MYHYMKKKILSRFTETNWNKNSQTKYIRIISIKRLRYVIDFLVLNGRHSQDFSQCSFIISYSTLPKWKIQMKSSNVRFIYLHFSAFAKRNRRNIFRRLCSILKHKLPIFNLKLWHSILCAQDLAKTDRFGMASQKFNFPASAAFFSRNFDSTSWKTVRCCRNLTTGIPDAFSWKLNHEKVVSSRRVTDFWVFVISCHACWRKVLQKWVAFRLHM